MKILVVTVGGTLEPIIGAWQSFHPDVTYFICSCDNRLTNRKGSYTQIIGTPDSPSASLVAKLDLSEDQWNHILVEPDDLIDIYKESTQLFQRLHAQWPEAQILADYTGGTKSMSAALVLASSQFAFVHLNVTTGNRQDLLKVSDGTQSLQPVNIGIVRAEWDFHAGIHHWRWYGYSAASLTLRPLLNSLERGSFRETVQMANALSQAFAHWDRFQYQEARKVLSVYDRAMSPRLRDYYLALKELSYEVPTPKQRFLGLWDLWLNSQRCVQQSRFDDAVARCYRLIEASGQWLLSRYGVDTARIDSDQLPPSMLNTSSDGSPLEFGLYRTWQLVPTYHHGPLVDEMSLSEGTWRNLIAVRNASYLGHGLRPVSADGWGMWQQWLASSFIPALKQEAEILGIKRFPEQLPTAFPDVCSAEVELRG